MRYDREIIISDIISYWTTSPGIFSELLTFTDQAEPIPENLSLTIFLNANLALSLLCQISDYLLFQGQTATETIHQHIIQVDEVATQLAQSLANTLTTNQKDSERDGLLTNTDKTLIQVACMVRYAANQMILRTISQLGAYEPNNEALNNIFQKKRANIEEELTLADAKNFGLENSLVIAIAALYAHQAEGQSIFFNQPLAFFKDMQHPLFSTLRKIAAFIIWQKEDLQTTAPRLRAAFNNLLVTSPAEIAELIFYHPSILAIAIHQYHLGYPKEAETILTVIAHIFSQLKNPSHLEKQGYFYFLVYIHRLQQNYCINTTEHTIEEFQTILTQIPPIGPSMPRPFFCIFEKQTSTLWQFVLGQKKSIKLTPAQVDQLELFLPKTEYQSRPTYECIEKLREYTGCSLHLRNVRDLLITYCLDANFFIEPDLQISLESPNLFYNDFLLAFAINLARLPAQNYAKKASKTSIFAKATEVNPPKDLLTGWWSLLPYFKIFPPVVIEEFETFWGYQFYYKINHSTDNLAQCLRIISVWSELLLIPTSINMNLVMIYTTYVAELCDSLIVGWKENARTSPIPMHTLLKYIQQLSLEQQKIIFTLLNSTARGLQTFMSEYSPQLKKIYEMSNGPCRDISHQISPHLNPKKVSFPRFSQVNITLPPEVEYKEIAFSVLILLTIATQPFTSAAEKKCYSSWKTFLMSAIADILTHHAESEIGLAFQETLQESNFISLLSEQEQKQFLWTTHPETARHFEALLLATDGEPIAKSGKSSKKKRNKPNAASDPNLSLSQSSPSTLVHTSQEVMQLLENSSTPNGISPIPTLSEELSEPGQEKQKLDTEKNKHLFQAPESTQHPELIAQKPDAENDNIQDVLIVTTEVIENTAKDFLVMEDIPQVVRNDEKKNSTNFADHLRETFGHKIRPILQQIFSLQTRMRESLKTSFALPISERFEENWLQLFNAMQEPLAVLLALSKEISENDTATNVEQTLPDILDEILVEKIWNYGIAQLQEIIEQILASEQIPQDKKLLQDLMLSNATLSRGGYYRHPSMHLPTSLLRCLEELDRLTAKHGFKMFLKGSTCISEKTLTSQHDIDIVFFLENTNYNLQTINRLVDTIRTHFKGESKAIHSDPRENYYQLRVNIPLSSVDNFSITKAQPTFRALCAEPMDPLHEAQEIVNKGSYCQQILKQSQINATVHNFVQDMDWTFMLTPELDPLAYTKKALVSPAAVLWDVQTGRQWMLAKTAIAIFRQDPIFSLIAPSEQSNYLRADKIGYLCKQWIKYAQWQIDPGFQAVIIEPLFAKSITDLAPTERLSMQSLLQATLRYVLTVERFIASSANTMIFICTYQLLDKAYPWEINPVLEEQHIRKACHLSFLKYFYPSIYNQTLPALAPVEYIALYCIAGILDKPPIIKENMITFLKHIRDLLPVKLEQLLTIIQQAPNTSYEWGVLAHMNMLQALSGPSNNRWNILLTYWHMQVPYILPFLAEPTTFPFSQIAPAKIYAQPDVSAIEFPEKSIVGNAHRQRQQLLPARVSGTGFFQGSDQIAAKQQGTDMTYRR